MTKRMRLTFILADTLSTRMALIHENQIRPYIKRSVRIDLTPEQIKLVEPRAVGTEGASKIYEEILEIFVEPNAGPSVVGVPSHVMNIHLSDTPLSNRARGALFRSGKVSTVGDIYDLATRSWGLLTIRNIGVVIEKEIWDYLKSLGFPEPESEAHRRRLNAI
ncbi:MAG: hypothetical protein GTO24_21260 [candidate division Zixibacteria bacterium]|nr:hypothetical protein [candidate division Zixibacteria bacterium]